MRVALGQIATITHLKVFGVSPYVLDVHTGKGDPIRGLEHVRLDALGAGWNELWLADPVSTDELVLELVRADGGDASTPAAVGEIELWGAMRPAMLLDAKAVGALTAGAGPRPGALPGVDVLAATGTAAIDLAPSTQPGGQSCGRLHFALTRSPASYRRAWLTYAADGAFRSFVLTRSLNAAPMRRGQWFSASTGPAPFVDPVDPGTLVLGDNHYEVCLPDDAVAHVVLHDAFFVGELDEGTNDAVSIARGPVDGMATEVTSELLDPDNAAPVTDSVALEVTQSPAGSSQTPDPVLRLARDATSTDPFVVDQSFQVKAGDRLEVHFRIDSPIDLTAIGFPQATILHWQYVSATDKDGKPVTVV
ncbi:MAG TPA: hypothetical protein VFK02_21780, partial [Kofleriaceae bacterium]|nr:hypothetical protein [Kofleriaceae bacterium]